MLGKNLAEICILQHGNEFKFDRVAPHERELRQGFGVVAFEQGETAAEVGGSPTANELAALRGWPPVALNRAIASSRLLASGLIQNVIMNFTVSSSVGSRLVGS